MENRKLVKQSPVRSSYFGYSTKATSVMAFESTLEEDYYHLLEFDESVQYFRPQPFTQPYLIGQKRHVYTPDFQVVQDGVAYLDEVKPFRNTLCPEFKRKVRRLTKLFSDDGFHFRVITEREIHLNHRHHNLRYLRPNLGFSAPLEEFERLREALPFRQSTVLALQEMLPGLGLSPCLVGRAVAHRLMQADLTQPWPDVVVSW